MDKIGLLYTIVRLIEDETEELSITNEDWQQALKNDKVLTDVVNLCRDELKKENKSFLLDYDGWNFSQKKDACAKLFDMVIKLHSALEQAITGSGRESLIDTYNEVLKFLGDYEEDKQFTRNR